MNVRQFRYRAQTTLDPSASPRGTASARPGDHATVTAKVSDDHADAYLDAGERFTLWSGGEVGHGTIYRRVFTDYGPS